MKRANSSGAKADAPQHSVHGHLGSALRYTPLIAAAAFFIIARPFIGALSEVRNEYDHENGPFA